MKRRYPRTQPGIDGPKARAAAQSFLCGARSLDGVTAPSIAHRYHLSEKMAEYMLTVARQRRERPA